MKKNGKPQYIVIDILKVYLNKINCNPELCLYFQYDNDYCMLLALPCGSDHDDIIYQTRAMSTGFIQYLQQKQAAGIVNVADPGSQQVCHVCFS